MTLPQSRMKGDIGETIMTKDIIAKRNIPVRITEETLVRTISSQHTVVTQATVNKKIRGAMDTVLEKGMLQPPCSPLPLPVELNDEFAIEATAQGMIARADTMLNQAPTAVE